MYSHVVFAAIESMPARTNCCFAPGPVKDECTATARVLVQRPTRLFVKAPLPFTASPVTKSTCKRSCKASLSRTVQELREEISELKTTTTRAQSSLRPSETRSEDAPPIGIMDLQSQNYASAASKGGESSINTTTTTSMNITRASDSGKQLADPNKTFYVVIYGITEYPSGTVRSERLTQDLAKVVAALSESGTRLNQTQLRIVSAWANSNLNILNQGPSL